VEIVYVNSVAGKVLKHTRDATISATHQSSVHLKNIKEYVEGRQNWENLVKQEKSKKDVMEGIEVEGDVGLIESEAKKEAERWKDIQFKEMENKE